MVRNVTISVLKRCALKEKWLRLSLGHRAAHFEGVRVREGEGAPLPRPQAHFILPHLNESAIFLSFHLQNASEGAEGGERGVGG